jgi:molybdopterin-containing oxidoreductase family iron-sulfur binding subunit
MGVNRRDFLRITGVGTLLGLGGKAAKDLLLSDKLEAQEYQPDRHSLDPQGKRWGMVVDMQKCIEKVKKDGCRDCMLACNKIHNIPEIHNHKHEIKWIWQEPYKDTFPGQQHEYMEEHLREMPFIVLCNHCDKPPCVRVCPTQATFQQEDGVVNMDFHRCIGCRYCMAACPYGSRSFNWFDPRKNLDPEKIDINFPTRMKGVVEKCNFCTERLAVGKMPKCVEACQAKALIFGNLHDADSEIRKVLRTHYTIRRKPELGTTPEVFYIPPKIETGHEA